MSKVWKSAQSMLQANSGPYSLSLSGCLHKIPRCIFSPSLPLENNNRVCPVHAHVVCFSSTWALLRLGWLWETSRKIIIVRKGEMIEVDAASLTPFLAEPGETGP